MRKDEYGEPCPETLGEYRDLCMALGGPDCEAVVFLDEQIAKNPGGRDEKVVQHDLQMRMVLFPMLVKKVG